MLRKIKKRSRFVFSMIIFDQMRPSITSPILPSGHTLCRSTKTMASPCLHAWGWHVLGWGERRDQVCTNVLPVQRGTKTVRGFWGLLVSEYLDPTDRSGSHVGCHGIHTWRQTHDGQWQWTRSVSLVVTWLQPWCYMFSIAMDVKCLKLAFCHCWVVFLENFLKVGKEIS